ACYAMKKIPGKQAHSFKDRLQHDNNPKHTAKKAASWFKCSQIVVVSPILRLKLKIILEKIQNKNNINKF
uniref:Tc1-like transposase DDE domain-containing protein n=1 Tax=Xiphophorus maculatus TaxID=8083 RepID=A0A3B5PXM7_XIPMA